MAKGFGYEFYEVLKVVIEGNPAKGVFVRDLRVLTEYHITRKQVDIKFASSMFTPLTEMYLVSQGIPHNLNRNREGVYVSGIGFQKPEARDLIDTLEMGIGSANETAAEANKLYRIIFGLNPA